MDLDTILCKERGRLTRAAVGAIRTAIRRTFPQQGYVGIPPEERHFVWNIVSLTAPALGFKWGAILGPYGVSLKVGAVYCHQTPMVHFDGMSKECVELGDLLFIHIHKSPLNPIRRFSLLLQAKKCDETPHMVKKDEEDQLHLYERWPEFTYTQSGSLTGQTRRVLPPQAHTGGQYLLIHPVANRKTAVVGACMPTKKLSPHAGLAEELWRVLVGASGRAFGDCAYARASNGWSRVMWDLLTATAALPFTREKTGVQGFERGQAVRFVFAKGGVFTTLAGNSLADDDFPDVLTPDGDRPALAEGDGFGVPAIVVCTETFDHEPRRLPEEPRGKAQ